MSGELIAFKMLQIVLAFVVILAVGFYVSEWLDDQDD